MSENKSGTVVEVLLKDFTKPNPLSHRIPCTISWDDDKIVIQTIKDGVVLSEVCVVHKNAKLEAIISDESDCTRDRPPSVHVDLISDVKF